MELLKTIFPTYDEKVLSDLFSKHNDVEYVVNFVLNEVVRKNDEELLKHVTDVNIETQELKKYEAKHNTNSNSNKANMKRNKTHVSYKYISLRKIFGRRQKNNTPLYTNTPLLIDYIPEVKNEPENHSSTC